LRWFVSLFRYKNTQKVVNQFLEYVCIETINGCLGIRLLRKLWISFQKTYVLRRSLV